MSTRRFAEGERVQKERRPPEPAPLQLHALLRMQQGAGNQAVGRILARAKYKPTEVRKQVNTAAADGAGTKDAILLAIYNEMRFTYDPLPPVFSKVDVATAKLIELGSIDADDVLAFAAAAEAKVSGGTGSAKGKKGKKAGTTVKSPEETLKAEIEADRGAIKSSMGDHVLKGAWRTDNRPSGFHTKNGGSTTHEGFGTITKVTDLVYQQSVRAVDEPRNVKPTQSTFFPDAANADDVIDAITSVYGKHGREKGRSTVGYPKALVGIKLTQRDGTAFPDADPIPGEGYDKGFKPKKR
ncbi:EndoU domain-containing protein [Solirubrobacter soli]|uniref:EndoU domain-containing protein n=1 Tax=Solirubrobacter soli TaxID=363832 RepID=UPI0005677DCF|nr:EndoU domain-containing protein [Solirubrobacter soli]